MRLWYLTGVAQRSKVPHCRRREESEGRRTLIWRKMNMWSPPSALPPAQNSGEPTNLFSRGKLIGPRWHTLLPTTRPVLAAAVRIFCRNYDAVDSLYGKLRFLPPRRVGVGPDGTHFPHGSVSSGVCIVDLWLDPATGGAGGDEAVGMAAL
mmetsp:Transcript_20598/g.46722  ORF Transcript_20598/g.46722 Transcript_20598/m.46722 type:complete len:151 (-) Transcript_20598:799-1251(-)